jgi:hypothetical protein
MSTVEDMFEMSADLDIRFDKLGGKIPVILIDNFYRRPDDIRDMALSLPYAPPSFPYPGKIASIPLPNRSLSDVGRKLLELINRDYLPRIPPVVKDGQTIALFRTLRSDFAVVDVHPDELTPTQRRPHVDPVPIFGLVYLNREERGGTLFFQRKNPLDAKAPGAGYVTVDSEGFNFVGRIEPAYNRMAIYPGFVPHSGDIAGDWIRGEERFKSPRLTQRFLFSA